MQGIMARIPKDPGSARWAIDVRNARAVSEFKEEVWASDGTEWTVVYSEEEELSPPTYSRFVNVRPVEDVMDTIAYASTAIQTVGLALTGPRRLKLANALTRRGVERCPEIGKMTHFETPWDGLIPMERLVRWTTLGGP